MSTWNMNSWQGKAKRVAFEATQKPSRPGHTLTQSPNKRTKAENENVRANNPKVLRQPKVLQIRQQPKVLHHPKAKSHPIPSPHDELKHSPICPEKIYSFFDWNADPLEYPAIPTDGNNMAEVAELNNLKRA